MKHLLSILCLFVLSCDSDGDNNGINYCEESDIYSNIDGITETDESGTVVDVEDDSDWECCSVLNLSKRGGEGRYIEAILPSLTSINPAYPNPSNGDIIIDYSIELSTSISIFVFDINGDKVDTIIENEPKDSGPNQDSWNPDVTIAEGIYRIVLEYQDDVYCYGDVCYCLTFQNCSTFCEF